MAFRQVREKGCGGSADRSHLAGRGGRERWSLLLFGVKGGDAIKWDWQVDFVLGVLRSSHRRAVILQEQSRG